VYKGKKESELNWRKKMATAKEIEKEHRDRLKKENNNVRRPIGRLDRDIIKSRSPGGGRKKKYTPTRMRNGINKYFEHCEEMDEVPSIAGMMIYLKLYKDAFYKYLQYPEFEDMMEHARLVIKHWVETDVYSSKGMCAGKIAYMKNVHDWSEKVNNNTDVTISKVTSVEEAESRLAELAPRLLELLGSKQVIDQIGKSDAIEGEILDDRRREESTGDGTDDSGNAAGAAGSGQKSHRRID
jgi:hypothetical protein